MYFFTSDQHFSHKNIIKYSNRPFSSVEEMDSEIIRRHNEVVSDADVVVHAGDFSMIKDTKLVYKNYISKLKGTNIFLKGSHDYWLQKGIQIWEKRIDGIYVVVCHYAMRVWPKSHYGAYHLYGHSHNRLGSYGKSFDVGVDGNNFYPYSFEDVKNKMNTLPDNFNLVNKNGEA